MINNKNHVDHNESRYVLVENINNLIARNSNDISNTIMGIALILNA